MMSKTSLAFLLMVLLLLYTVPSTIPSASAAVTFQNGFESANFGGWSGTGTTTGESASVVTLQHHHGSYSARFSSNGNGGYERSYCYKSTAASDEIWARCYAYVAQSGINSIGDRFFFIILRSGSDNVAYAGWKMDTDGKIKWCLTINEAPLNAFYADVLNAGVQGPYGNPPFVPSLNRWYCIELMWHRGASPC